MRFLLALILVSTFSAVNANACIPTVTKDTTYKVDFTVSPRMWVEFDVDVDRFETAKIQMTVRTNSPQLAHLEYNKDILQLLNQQHSVDAKGGKIVMTFLVQGVGEGRVDATIKEKIRDRVFGIAITTTIQPNPRCI